MAKSCLRHAFDWYRTGSLDPKKLGLASQDACFMAAALVIPSDKIPDVPEDMKKFPMRRFVAYFGECQAVARGQSDSPLVIFDGYDEPGRGLKLQSFGIIDLDRDGDLDVGIKMENGAILVFHNQNNFGVPQPTKR